MRIRYNQKQSAISALLGSILIVLSITSLVVYDSHFLFGTWYGIAQIAIAFYRYYVPCVTIKDGILKKDLGAKILLTDIIEARRFAGDYIFKSAKKTISIDRNSIDKKSADQLDVFFHEVRDGKFRPTTI